MATNGTGRDRTAMRWAASMRATGSTTAAAAKVRSPPHMTPAKGAYHYGDGGEFDGIWAEDKRNGEGKLLSTIARVGTFVHTNGDKYVGNWVNDKRCGKGIH